MEAESWISPCGFEIADKTKCWVYLTFIAKLHLISVLRNLGNGTETPCSKQGKTQDRVVIAPSVTVE